MVAKTQRSFISGELTPALHSRVDLSKYHTGLAVCRNSIIRKSGGAYNRPGTIFKREVKFSSRKTRLIPFISSREGRYVIELGHGYMRIHAPKTSTDFFELNTPYEEDEIFQVDYTQVVDVMTFTHANHPPTQLRREFEGGLLRFTFAAAQLDVVSERNVAARPVSLQVLNASNAAQSTPSGTRNWSYVVTWLDENGVESGPINYITQPATGNSFSYPITHIGASTLPGQSQFILFVLLRVSGDPTRNISAGDMVSISVVGAPSLDGRNFRVFSVRNGQIIIQPPGGFDYTGTTTRTLTAHPDNFVRSPAAPNSAIEIQSVTAANPCVLTFTRATTALQDGDFIHIFALGLDELNGATVRIRVINSTSVELLGIDARDLDVSNFVASSIFSIVVLATNKILNHNIPSSLKVRLRWDHVSPVNSLGQGLPGAKEYNIYKSEDGGDFGLLGITTNNQFEDIGQSTELKVPPTSTLRFKTRNDYPATVAFIQQRMGFSGTNRNPEKIYLSRAGDFLNFAVRSPLAPDDAFSFTPAGNELNRIKWMFDIHGLILLGDGSEWIVKGDDAGAISPTSINTRQQGQYGAGDVRPLIIGKTGLFVPEKGPGVRDISYYREGGGMVSFDLTVFADHLFKGNAVIDWTYQQVPDSIIWCVMEDGSFLGMTRLPEQEILAWHRHDMNDAKVKSVTDINNDDVYFIVERVVNPITGETKQYIEFMENRDMTEVFMDSSVVVVSPNSDNMAQTVTGLDHLENQDVAVVGDNAVLANPNNPKFENRITVRGGQITLPQTYEKVIVGLPFISDIKTLNIDIADPNTISDKYMLVKRVTLLLDKTRGLFIGGAEPSVGSMIGKLTELRHRSIDRYSQFGQLTTGKVSHNIDPSWNSNGSVFLRQIDPVPFGLLAITPEGQIPLRNE